MCSRLCAKFHAGTKVQNRNFWILDKIDFSAQTTHKFVLTSDNPKEKRNNFSPNGLSYYLKRLRIFEVSLLVKSSFNFSTEECQKLFTS